MKYKKDFLLICRPGGTIGAWFNECFENTMHAASVESSVTFKFYWCLNRKKISHISFQGRDFKKLLPFPELRVGTDMDVVIRPAEYINAVEC